ncbi:hypothetical protein KSP40_PGU015319 [Platanthera guangdongensis]|uniref:Phospholipase/carboxylesterase/thioesterase domain-containing protein n=1 Tax=Platanthera guangdongensis TaxID=2320717 RepID=A0ABR2MIF1_9ASPA
MAGRSIFCHSGGVENLIHKRKTIREEVTWRSVALFTVSLYTVLPTCDGLGGRGGPLRAGVVSAGVAVLAGNLLAAVPKCGWVVKNCALAGGNMSLGSSSLVSGAKSSGGAFEFGRTHVVRPKGKHQATIVWLHGLGDNGARILPLAELTGILNPDNIEYLFMSLVSHCVNTYLHVPLILCIPLQGNKVCSFTSDSFEQVLLVIKSPPNILLKTYRSFWKHSSASDEVGGQDSAYRSDRRDRARLAQIELASSQVGLWLFAVCPSKFLVVSIVRLTLANCGLRGLAGRLRRPADRRLLRLRFSIEYLFMSLVSHCVNTYLHVPLILCIPLQGNKVCSFTSESFEQVLLVIKSPPNILLKTYRSFWKHSSASDEVGGQDSAYRSDRRDLARLAQIELASSQVGLWLFAVCPSKFLVVSIVRLTLANRGLRGLAGRPRRPADRRLVRLRFSRFLVVSTVRLALANHGLHGLVRETAETGMPPLCVVKVQIVRFEHEIMSVPQVLSTNYTELFL